MFMSCILKLKFGLILKPNQVKSKSVLKIKIKSQKNISTPLALEDTNDYNWQILLMLSLKDLFMKSGIHWGCSS